MKSGWGIKLIFAIHLHVKDIDVLYTLQKYFGVGNVTLHKDTAIYQVVAIKDLLKIIEHFNLKYMLYIFFQQLEDSKIYFSQK